MRFPRREQQAQKVSQKDCSQLYGPKSDTIVRSKANKEVSLSYHIVSQTEDNNGKKLKQIQKVSEVMVAAKKPWSHSWERRKGLQ